jgi:hypothetical protein
MRFIETLFFAFLCIAAVCQINASKKQSQGSATSENKIQQISELAAKARGNMITLDDATYNYYAISKPRPYSLIVFMTAAHPKFKCNICKQIDSEMSLVAQAYQQSITTKGEEAKVFFVRLDYESSQKMFQNYGVASVPMVFHVPMSLSASDGGNNNNNNKQDFSITVRDKYQIPMSPDAESIGNFLRDRTGISVEIKRSMIGSYLLLLAIFGVLALLVKPVLDALPMILSFIRNTSLWAVVSAGVYTCAISGLIFDIIRSPQM